MDLREAVERVKTASEGANSSFHAGRKGEAERYLYEIEKLVVEYLRMPATPAGDVTESATSEKPEASQKETPAQAEGARAQPGAVLPGSAAQRAALDQAGP